MIRFFGNLVIVIFLDERTFFLQCGHVHLLSSSKSSSLVKSFKQSPRVRFLKSREPVSGIGKDNTVNAWNVVEVAWHSKHFNWEAYWPWKRFTIILKFVLRYLSHSKTETNLKGIFSLLCSSSSVNAFNFG
ncbi:hypothetical protein WICPIJ_001589 [Wickerhamomyces pijperi]|uniref:Uncharacterized protein n=1 Tax=Wickerhamomyces pijperi TaxID=599730 RepID=A0A9P8QBA4_WICPI|nr:hypothetical protein WICPIJ_001589 [Wickerhamomyces pijperi]